jgi:hypothetical protein
MELAARTGRVLRIRGGRIVEDSATLNGREHEGERVAAGRSEGP